MITRNGKHTNGAQLLEGFPHTLAHGAEEGATKVAEVVETAGARIARGAAMGRSMLKRRTALLPSGDAMLKAQLVKTSRELAHESSDLNAAVESLNKLIKRNQRAAARGRTRLLSGLALGAALMYHLDAEHGRERRAATARLLTSMARGRRGPQSPAA